MFNELEITMNMFHLLKITLGNYLWQEEVKDKYCANYAPNHNVSSQQECQRRCVEKIGCVGISYSHIDNSQSNYCYVCMDDDLTAASNNFGFYRRPGIVDR